MKIFSHTCSLKSSMLAVGLGFVKCQYSEVHCKNIYMFRLQGPFHINGPKHVCYTKALELVGNGVGTGLVWLYFRPACAQARHA